ncbi:Elongator subunit elp4 [Allomyces javanicus]|nr:Elongator subunit elp4 [Allomyces javanicus]
MSSFRPATGSNQTSSFRPATSSFRPAATPATSAATPVSATPAPAPAATAPVRPLLPAGTRLSAHNGQVLVSTGIASLDDLLGGGQPLGTVLVLDEDVGTGYATLAMQYSLSQALAHGHHVLVASADDDPAALVAGCPQPAVVGGNAPAASEKGNDEAMKIAWRYQHMPKYGDAPDAGRSLRKAMGVRAATSAAPAYCGVFDLTKRMGAMSVEDEERVHAVRLGEGGEDEDSFEAAYAAVYRTLSDGGFFASAPPPPSGQRSVLRLAIHAMCSPLWGQRGHNHHRFLIRLKALLRHAYASAIITVSSAWRGPRALLDAHADFSLAFDAFASSATLPASIRTNPYLTREYAGLVAVRKLARVNALVPASVKVAVGMVGQSLAFHVRRKRFTIEAWHLPPELGGDQGDDDGRSKDQAGNKGTARVAAGGCGTVGGRNVDF